MSRSPQTTEAPQIVDCSAGPASPQIAPADTQPTAQTPDMQIAPYDMLPAFVYIFDFATPESIYVNHAGLQLLGYERDALLDHRQ
ncbi:MAG: hypothetical protein H3C34_14205, partial [Caldilineaceae bacterium]|nr:hypothetical protein [Caldilineaceae bacterium]